MDEFTAKKLGEVLAFAQIGAETFERGKAALEEAFGEEEVGQIINEYKRQASELKEISGIEGSGEIALGKAEGTKAKLREMQDTYVGDEWDNPSELLEWLGFFEGAAIVHWRLVRGAGEKVKSQRLTDLAKSSIDFHTNLLNSCGETLEEIGKK